MVTDKTVTALTEERFWTTHGHGQQYGDWLGEGKEWAWEEVGKGRKRGTT